MRVQIIRVPIDGTRCRCRQLRLEIFLQALTPLDCGIHHYLPCIWNFDRHLVSKPRAIASICCALCVSGRSSGFQLASQPHRLFYVDPCAFVYDNRIHLEARYVTPAQVGRGDRLLLIPSPRRGRPSLGGRMSRKYPYRGRCCQIRIWNPHRRGARCGTSGVARVVHSQSSELCSGWLARQVALTSVGYSIAPRCCATCQSMPVIRCWSEGTAVHFGKTFLVFSL